MSGVRAIVCVGLLAATAVIARAAQSSPPTAPDLNTLPLSIGGWRGAQARALDPEIVRELGVDRYITRTYTEGGVAPVGLYVAYYASQRSGGTIHSPLNCLPGTGWEPVEIGTIAAPSAAGFRGELRRMVVQKRGEQALVLYWYQIHGRMLASELASKGYLIRDMLTTRRSDAALVRIVVPIAQSTAEAERVGVAFVRALLPALNPLWS